MKKWRAVATGLAWSFIAGGIVSAMLVPGIWRYQKPEATETQIFLANRQWHFLGIVLVLAGGAILVTLDRRNDKEN